MQNNIAQMYQQFMQNREAMLRNRFNIPNGVNINDPNAIIQHLLNTGQVSQGSVNQVMQMRNNPMMQQFMNRR